MIMPGGMIELPTSRAPNRRFTDSAGMTIPVTRKSSVMPVTVANCGRVVADVMEDPALVAAWPAC